MAFGSINTYLHFWLTESTRNGNRTSVSNCLYSVTQYNGSAHTELKLSTYVRRGADKSLTGLGRKQATVIKLGIYST